MTNDTDKTLPPAPLTPEEEAELAASRAAEMKERRINEAYLDVVMNEDNRWRGVATPEAVEEALDLSQQLANLRMLETPPPLDPEELIRGRFGNPAKSLPPDAKMILAEAYESAPVPEASATFVLHDTQPADQDFTLADTQPGIPNSRSTLDDPDRTVSPETLAARRNRETEPVPETPEPDVIAVPSGIRTASPKGKGDGRGGR